MLAVIVMCPLLLCPLICIAAPRLVVVDHTRPRHTLTSRRYYVRVHRHCAPARLYMYSICIYLAMLHTSVGEQIVALVVAIRIAISV